MEEARHSAMIERLKARETQRSADASKRHQEQQEAGVEKESAAAFLADFAARRGALEAAVQAYAGDGAGGDAAARDLADQVTQLEQAVAAAAYFLPPYDLRAATAAAAALRDALQAATQARQPRKKFSFSKKPVAPAAPPPEPPAGPPSEPVAAPAPAAPAGLTISGLRGQEVVLTAADVGPAQDVTLADLQGCTLWLLAPLGALFAHRLSDCTIVAGPVDGALHAEDLRGCAVHAAARQARIHGAADSAFYLRLRAGPIIELSNGLGFAPLAAGEALAYPGAAAALEAQGLADDGGQWGQVQDFGWLRAAASPHWRVLPPGERAPPPPPPPTQSQP